MEGCLWVIAILGSLSFSLSSAEVTVTIHPEILSQNGRSHFESDRWDNHNGLDNDIFISPSKVIGTESGRWLNRDINGNVYKNTPENHQRKGYPDLGHFSTQNLQKTIAEKYKHNLNGYGKDLDTVMCLNGKVWPHWLDTSHHGGMFPNNLDAGAEFAVGIYEGISKYTGGVVPPYLEVINEPDALYQHVSWDATIEWHKVTAAKIKAKFPHVKVGGPTYTGAINSMDKNDFHVWKNIRQFLDMSLYHLDFFSFHPYTSFHSHGGSHYFRGTNEARLVGIIDLVESYSHQKRGKSLPLIPSEFGLGGRDLDSHTTKDQIRWAYAYVHNAYTFTFLNHRDVMERAVGFILAHAVPAFEDASLFTSHGQQTFLANAYKFWNSFNNNQQFLRVESAYDGQERTVSPLAVADPHNEKLTVLLHNYGSSYQQVRLNFPNNWITPTDAKSSCIYLDSSKTPHFSQNQNVHLNNHQLTLPAESSCFYTFQTAHNFFKAPVVNLGTHYAKAQAVSIHNNAVQTSINIPSGHYHSAQLRFGVSLGKNAHTTPTYVHINGHQLTKHYSLYDADRPSAATLWDVFLYDVPINFLKQGENTIKLNFRQNGGHVSTVALLVGTVSGDNSHVVG